MRITLLAGIMDHPASLAKGAIVDRPDGVAMDWIARGLAVATPHEARVIQATAPSLPVTHAEVGAEVRAAVEAAPADPPGVVVAPSPRRSRRA